MRNKGFTLIELIVVIAIIAILAAIVVPNAVKAVEKAKVARLTQDIKVLKMAAMAYYADIGLWPPDVYPAEDPGFLQWDAYKVTCGTPTGYPSPEQEQRIKANWGGPYLEKFPRTTPWGGSYDWEYWPTGGWGGLTGIYISVRPKYNSIQFAPACAWTTNGNEGAVPTDMEIKLQQEGIDEYHPNGIDEPDGHVIIKIVGF